MRRWWLALGLVGCGEDGVAPGRDEGTAIASPCPGSDEAFAFRALRLLHGRRPEGVRELAVLAGLVRGLDAAGLHGREVVARGLARDEAFVMRWRSFLLDQLRVPRVGATVQLECHGRAGVLAGDARLAAFVRDHGPEDVAPDGLAGWTMADLFVSSVRLDDLSPLLRAQLVAREGRVVGGNNVEAAALERAQRVHLGRGFEAAYLGRRLECVGCHDGGGGTPVDHADPRLDRSWPVLIDAERAVYGAGDEDAVYAGFRVHGFVGGSLRPWGWSGCGEVSPGRAGDLIGGDGAFAGALPAGAHALDLEGRLRSGLEDVRADGLMAEGEAAALAGLVALHLADAVWREAAGSGLVLAHGLPRNAWQREVLGGLAEVFVDEGYSLRALAVAAVLHPALDLAEARACGGVSPPIFDPFAPDNDVGDTVRRESTWLLIDSAAHALGWASAERVPLFGWTDERLMRSLGAYFDDSEPGHRGIDVIQALAWEASVGAGEDPGWGAPGEDHVAKLVAVARTDADATVEELALAVLDRVLQVTEFSGEDQRAAVEALIGAPLAARVATQGDEIAAGLRRFAGALLNTPQFLLAGVGPPVWRGAPRLVVADASFKKLCERHAEAVLRGTSGVTWVCHADRVEVGFTQGARR